MATESTQELINGLKLAKQEAEATLVFWERASKEVIKTGNAISKSFEGLDLKDSKDISKLSTELAKVNEVTKSQVTINKELTVIEKEKIALDKQLIAATDENVKAKIRLQNVNKKQKDILKDTLILEDKEAGTLQKIAASSRQLRREREGLNLETEKGRKRLEAINISLDKNNAKIDKNSDKLKKQRINVGNYTKSTKDAIQQSGLFGRELAILQRIQGTLGVLMKKNTAETQANAVAQKAAGSASGKFSKALKVLKFAIIGTGIGAIVIGLTALIGAFAGTQRGADAFTKVLRPLSTIFQKFIGFLENTAFKALDQLKDAFTDPKQAVIDLGNSIKDNLVVRFLGFIDVFKTGGTIISNGFTILASKIKLALSDVPIIGKSIDVEKVTKDLEKATSEITSNFKDLGDAAIQATLGIEDGLDKIAESSRDVADEFRKASDEGTQLDNLIKKFERRQIDLVIPIAKARLEYQKLKETANDQLNTDEQRIEALNEAAEVQKFISDSEGELLDLKIARVELEQSFNDTSREEELELANLKAEKIRFEEAAQKKISGLVSLRSGIELRAVKAQNKAVSDTTKQVDELELRLNSNSFEVASIKATRKFEAEKKSIRDNELIDIEKQNELILKLKIQLQIDLLKIENDRIDSETEKKKEEKKEDLKDTKEDLAKKEELYQKSIDVVDNIFQKSFDKRNKQLDDDLKANQEAQSKIQKGIDAGNEDAKKSLAEEEKREAELLAKKEKARKDQIRAEAAVALFKAYGESGGDLGKTIADTAVLTALINSLSFYHGTDETPDDVMFADKHGGVTGFVHAKEQVWSNKDRADVGYRTRDEIKDIVNRDLITDPTQAIYMAQVDNSSLEAKVDTMTESILTLHRRMPKQSSSYNGKTKEYEDVIEFGNRKETIRHKSNTWA